MIDIFYWFLLINYDESNHTLFYELTWVLINLASLTNPEFIRELMREDLFVFVNKCLASKTIKF